MFIITLITIGRIEIKIIAIITKPKLSLTKGILPKKYPPKTKRAIQAIPPAML